MGSEIDRSRTGRDSLEDILFNDRTILKGGDDENSNQLGFGGIAAERLHQQQQSVAAGENYGGGAAKLWYDGGLSERLESALLAGLCKRRACRQSWPAKST
jgi:hypothetical protein